MKKRVSREERVGKRYGYWLVLGISKRKGYVFCECQGKCSPHTRRDVYASHLDDESRSRSCNCMARENAVDMRIEMIGKSYGYWKVIGLSNDRSKVVAECHGICDPMTVRDVDAGTLRDGFSTNCSCIKNLNFKERVLADKGIDPTDILNKQKNYLLPKEYIGKDENGKHIYKCICLYPGCGNEKLILRERILNGDAKSCGNHQYEIVADSLKQHFNKNEEWKKYIGQKRHSLIVLGRSEKPEKISPSDRGRYLFIVKCVNENHGNKCEKIFRINPRHFGIRKTCGCGRHARRNPEEVSPRDIICFRKGTSDKLRLLVIKRDGCKCLLCKGRFDAKDLAIHHLDPISHFLDIYDPETYSWGYDLDNLGSLCPGCHKKVHTVNGQHNTKCINIELQTILFAMEKNNASIYDEYIKIVDSVIMPFIEYWKKIHIK